MLLPRRLSARAWEDLIACPYRYWAQNVWRLGPRDEIQDTTSQRDYGNTVHHILYQTHLRFEQQPDQDFGALLQAVAEEIFTGLAQRYPDAFAWQERFEAWKIDYLPWWEQQRKQGWRWCGGELRREYALPLAQGQSLTLYGRIDRLDQHEQEQRLRVLDYKAKSQKQLKKMQLQIGEQTQLLFYGLLCLTEAEQARLGLNAAYLPVDELETSLTLYEALEDDSLFMQALQAEQRRLQSVWLGLNHGTVLWAQGSAEACRYCAMRGLCRRDEREAPGQTAEPIV
jgi:ATP-dependent helicase/nuclease subunit B